MKNSILGIACFLLLAVDSVAEALPGTYKIITYNVNYLYLPQLYMDIKDCERSIHNGVKIWDETTTGSGRYSAVFNDGDCPDILQNVARVDVISARSGYSNYATPLGSYREDQYLARDWLQNTEYDIEHVRDRAMLDRRKDEIRDWILSEDPDIVAFQELNGMSPVHFDEWAGEMGFEYSRMVIMDPTAKQVHHGERYFVGIASKYPITDIEQEYRSTHVSRSFLNVMIRGINFIVVHITHRRSSTPPQCVNEAHYLAKTVYDESKPTIMVGDFNNYSISNFFDVRDNAGYPDSITHRIHYDPATTEYHRNIGGVVGNTLFDGILFNGGANLTDLMVAEKGPDYQFIDIIAANSLLLSQIRSFTTEHPNPLFTDGTGIALSDHPATIATITIGTPVRTAANTTGDRPFWIQNLKTQLENMGSK